MKTVKLSFDLIQSRAFAELTGSAVKVLMLLKMRYIGTNNGTIPFGYSDGLAFGFAKDTTKRALKDLQNKGFIRHTKKGVNKNSLSEWLLIDDWKQYPNNAKDAELIALLKTKSGDKNDGNKKRPTKANNNEPAPVMQNVGANVLLQSLENLKRKQGLL